VFEINTRLVTAEFVSDGQTFQEVSRIGELSGIFESYQEKTILNPSVAQHVFVVYSFTNRLYTHIHTVFVCSESSLEP
jgi:hypothetical protein